MLSKTSPERVSKSAKNVYVFVSLMRGSRDPKLQKKRDRFDDFGGLGPPVPQEGPKDPSRHPPRSKSYPKRYLNGCPTHHVCT